MESDFFQKLVLALLLSSCASEHQGTSHLDTNRFENGDLIYRSGNGLFSKYFRQVSDSIQTYSHVGIVQVSDDSIHVIHSAASELSFVGYVRRDPIEDWLKGINDWGLYRLRDESSIRSRIVKTALKYHSDSVLFDMDFSIEDDSEIYCTELIALCVNKAVNSDLIRPETVIMGKSGYSIDDTILVDGIFEVTNSEEAK